MENLLIDMGSIVRWLHVMAGVMWIGLLWYFNFVQIPTMPSIPDDLKPAIGKHIAPEALFWFRWAAAATVFFGLGLAGAGGYMMDAFKLGLGMGNVGVTMIGLGMWMGLIMAFNVWFVIWPKQKIALGMVDGDKVAAARTAMLFSRTNTLLSIPMLYCMLYYAHPAMG
jgi:uncharacterized membrane protein